MNPQVHRLVGRSVGYTSMLLSERLITDRVDEYGEVVLLPHQPVLSAHLLHAHSVQLLPVMRQLWTLAGFYAIL